MKLDVSIETHALRAPQRIAGYSFDTIETLMVALEHDGHVGRGEANGLYYRHETARAMAAQVEGLRSAIEGGLDREALSMRLDAGGARNAIDCAMWELESLRRDVPVAVLAGLGPLHDVTTTRTIYADDPAAMAAQAVSWADAPTLKLKLLGDGEDAARVMAVRDARTDATLTVDANQSLDVESYDALLTVLVDTRVALVEQPFAIGHESSMDGVDRPVPVAADESVLTRDDLDALEGRFDVVNIKLDKSGGLTEALALVDEARRRGFGTMVGCMCATSLAMAPAFIVAQRCEWADIDGPLYLAADRTPQLRYEGARVRWTSRMWGAA